jgi:hypothetical protein
MLFQEGSTFNEISQKISGKPTAIATVLKELEANLALIDSTQFFRTPISIELSVQDRIDGRVYAIANSVCDFTSAAIPILRLQSWTYRNSISLDLTEFKFEAVFILE